MKGKDAEKPKNIEEYKEHPQEPTIDLEGDEILELPELLEVLEDESQPEERKFKLISKSLKIAFQTTRYQGPIPPPELLEGYNRVIENGAERIFVDFESQSSHRREIEKTVIESQLAESRRGQLFALVISIFGLSIAAILGYLGHDWLAAGIGGTTLVSLVGAFITGKILQKRDLDEKESQL